MKLVHFSQSGSGASLYLNPDHVVSVTAQPKFTAILTTGLDTHGNGITFSVQEDEQTVVKMLTAIR